MDVQRAKELIRADPWARLHPDVELWTSAGVVPYEVRHSRVDRPPTPGGDETEPRPTVAPVVGRAQVLAEVGEPLRAAVPDGRWEPYVYLGGRWQDQTWVAATGEIVGRMTDRWGPVPSIGGPVRVRYGMFHRVVTDEVVEIRLLFDLLSLAAHVLGERRHELLPPFAGRDGSPPGPELANGLTTAPAPPDETTFTLRLVEDMIGGCNRLVDGELRSMGMDAYWHDDMRWYGPWGVGATHGFDEFSANAQGPSVAAFPDRRGGFHQARIADGVTAAFTGWPSLRGRFDGQPFRGIEPTGTAIGQNIMDFYVRRGELLHENWVLIDLVDFAAQCGVDLLAPLG